MPTTTQPVTAPAVQTGSASMEAIWRTAKAKRDRIHKELTRKYYTRSVSNEEVSRLQAAFREASAETDTAAVNLREAVRLERTS